MTTSKETTGSEGLAQADANSDVSSEKVTDPATHLQKERLSRARRTLARTVAANLIAAMAGLDVGLDVIADRLSRPTKEIQNFIYDLIDGSGDFGIDVVSDFCFALDVELDFSICRVDEQPPSNGERTSGLSDSADRLNQSTSTSSRGEDRSHEGE